MVVLKMKQGSENKNSLIMRPCTLIIQRFLSIKVIDRQQILLILIRFHSVYSA